MQALRKRKKKKTAVMYYSITKIYTIHDVIFLDLFLNPEDESIKAELMRYERLQDVWA